MRAELMGYLSGIQNKTNEDGENLVEFPEDFAANTPKQQQQQEEGEAVERGAGEEKQGAAQENVEAKVAKSEIGEVNGGDASEENRDGDEDEDDDDGVLKRKPRTSEPKLKLAVYCVWCGCEAVIVT